MADDLEYLSPDFDPTSLTIPKLRSLLVEYNVSYPSSAKKAQLVELFNENIAPQAKHILSARARTRPSTRGIKDVPSSQASAAGDNDAAEMPPPLTKSPSKRKSRRVTDGPIQLKEEDALEAPATAPVRRTSGKQARSSDAADGKPVRRKSRKSGTTPTVKLEGPEPEDDSPFTYDNPFQSGSSPLAPDQGQSRDRRRKTTGPVERTEKRKSSGGRRKSDVYGSGEADGALVPTRKRVDVPISRLKQEDDDDIPAGEEFTPEEQLELVRARAANGQLEVQPRRRRKAPSRAGGIVKAGSSAFLVAMLGGLGTVWRQEKLEVGYCGVGRPSTQLAGVDIPDWAKVIQPQCEPCPPHAYCYANLRTDCEPDFILRQHPLSLNGLVPLPPTCEPDSEKARRVKAVADRAVEELRVRNAQYECGEITDEAGKAVSTAEVKEEELKEAVSTMRRKGMSQSEFDDLWSAAIGDILSRDEVVSGSDGFAVSTTDQVEASHPPPSPESASPATSEDPSEQRWSDIFGDL